MTPTRHAVVLGEALIDLLDGEIADQPVFRQVIGGAPLNVAVGIARLGGHVTFAGALGDDVLAERIIGYLQRSGVQTHNTARVAAPTALAVATFHGAEPDFRFYGQPPSYLLYETDHLDTIEISQAAVLYCGSIGLLGEPFLSTARTAWAIPGPLRLLDPNVRPSLIRNDGELERLRTVVEEFARTADLLKLSTADVHALYGPTTVEQAVDHFRALGTRAVVITQGPDGAVVSHARGTHAIPAPAAHVIDTTGAGDSVMAALAHRLLTHGWPSHPDEWRQHIQFALQVAAVVVESYGGAAAMPTRDAVRRRFPRAQDAAESPATASDPRILAPAASYFDISDASNGERDTATTRNHRQ